MGKSVGRLRNGILAALIAGATAPASEAIIRRHDVPDEKYLSHGRAFRELVALVSIPREKGTAVGTGTLIGKNWVITAAHVARGLKEGSEASVQIGDTRYDVAEIITNPTWRSGLPGEDLALLRLATPTATGGINCLYGGDQEVGQVVTLAGYGDPGDGLRGPVEAVDQELRAATVRINSAEGSVLAWTFRSPSDPRVTPLEGISGPADSGGPALIRAANEWCLVGVSSTQSDPDDVGEGRYGVTEKYARISYHRRWLEKTMLRAAASRPAGERG